MVKKNQLKEAAIIKVDKARFELKLSLRKSDTLPNPDKVRSIIAVSERNAAQYNQASVRTESSLV